MKIKKQRFGVLSDGTKVNLFTIKNDNMSFSCTNYGCTITSIVLNNKDGSKTDVVLGFSTLEGYINTKLCFGTIVGRFANRIGGGNFLLNGTKFELDKNDGENTLHGGYFGFDKIVWDAEIIEEKDRAGVRFSRLSVDGEQGFHGNLNISISYILDENNNLICQYNGETDKSTPINITNHSYFNLAGKGTIENHTLKLNSDKYLEIDNNLIPTGNFADSKGGPFDFTEEKTIGRDIEQVAPGYDHCYVTGIYNSRKKQCGVPLSDDKLTHFGVLWEPASGREMNIYTNMEGCQVYTANWIQDVIGKNGVKYNNHDGVCFEAQCFPDSPNKKQFPTCVLEPGQKMKGKTVYSFKF